MRQVVPPAVADETCMFCHCLQNPHIYRAYEARKKELSGPTYRELHVYHGSKTNAPQLIIKNGFNVAYGAAMSG